MLKRWPIKTILKDLLYYTAGSILYGIGVYIFAKNANFVPGGVTGIALLINLTGFPIGLASILINIPLALISYRIIGKEFICKSLITMLISSLFIDVIFPFFPTYSGNRLLAAVFTGIFLGAGMAIIYMRGSSSGGSDFIVISIRTKKPHITVGQLTLIIDMVIIVAGGLVYQDIDAVLYGIVASMLATVVMDNVLYGAGSSKLAIIISSDGKAVADAIMEKVYRGATIIDVTGAYTGERRYMVLCACSKSELYKVRNVTRSVDEGALFMVTEASEVVGEGFVPTQLPGGK